MHRRRTSLPRCPFALTSRHDNSCFTIHAASHCARLPACPNNHRVPRTARPRAAVIVGTRLRPTFPLKQQRRSHLEAPRRRHQRETRTYDSHLAFGDPAAQRVQPASNAPLHAANHPLVRESGPFVVGCTALRDFQAIWSYRMTPI